MKKVILIAVLLVMAVFVLPSCNHQCVCTLYENGQVVGVSTEVVHMKSCSSRNTVVETPFGKMGLECVKD